MNAPDPIAAILRGDVTLRWVPLGGTELEVMTDALCVEGVRAPVSARTAQRIADLLTLLDPEGHTVSLSTPAVVDRVFEQAALRPPPMTLWAPGRNLAEYRWAVEHSRRLDDWLLERGATPELLVAPVGKDWVLTDRITERRACNYGWHRVGARPLQPESYRHGPDHQDYSQTLRLVRVPPGAPFPGRGRVTRQPGVELPTPPVTDPRPLAVRALDACLDEARAQGCDVDGVRDGPVPSAVGRRVPAARVAEYLRGAERDGSAATGRWLASEVLSGRPQPFCAAAQGWAEHRVGRPDEPLPPWRAAVRELRADAQAGRRGTWLPIDAVRLYLVRPEPGDLALYTRGNPGAGLGHVDRVVALDGSSALTIGANEQGGRWVIERVALGDARLEGFVRG